MISKRSNTASAKGRDALCVPVQKVKDMEEVSDNGRVASDRALVSDQAASRLAPSGFDPSRWPEIEWDNDGYPVGEDDDFAAFDSLPMDFWQAAQFLLRELPACASHCCAWCEVTDAIDPYDDDRKLKLITFSTGGWSGAESLIGLIESRYDTAHFMLSWRRGGHFVFEIPMRLLSRDSDGSGEGDKTGTGLAVGDSADPKGIAQGDAA